jgi:hypothetical protein
MFHEKCFTIVYAYQNISCSETNSGVDPGNDAERGNSMRLFRSRWLKGISPFLLLALLGAGPFVVVEQQWDGKDKDEFVIRTPQSSGTLVASIRMLQIIYGLNATHISRVPFFTDFISENYVPGTSFDPISTDLLTNPNRGPPRLIAIL